MLFLIALLLPASGAYSVAHSTSQIPSTVYQMPGFRLVGQLQPSQEILISVAVPLKNVNLLYSYVKLVSTPGSPYFRHYLTRSQITKLFIPTQQYESVLNYLKSHGFKVVLTAMDSVIVVEGTAQQAKDYLGLGSALYSNGTFSYYTLTGEPSIDAYVYSSNITGMVIRPQGAFVTQSGLQRLASSLQPNMTLPIQALDVKQLWSVYNVTGLMKSGVNGSGTDIGILDWYGDPYIAQALYAFDKEFGLPNPPSFKVVPVGPYDPNTGVLEGWDGEISGDVELSHAMAPGANVTLYIGNGALPIFVPISFIDSQDIVNTTSQSWAINEWYYSVLGPSFYVANAQLADEYYALGSLEGITFIASTGDAGGSGYSSGTIGTTGYPSTSPYVTAAGGTTVYVSGNSSLQTAWSNYGFIPFMVNYGGSTGGVSMLEPTPWYQEDIPLPASYPHGRMVPDISLSASAFPGTWVVFSGNKTGIFGGTSEASPLLAGLLSLAMAKLGHPLGLINPFLYSINYSYGAITPITFGYNIPWTAHYGYNLVTGLGSINVGNLVTAYKSYRSMPELNVTVYAYNSSLMVPAYSEFLPGQKVVVLANVTGSSGVATSGSFTAYLETLQGTVASAQMTYSPSLGMWVANITVPQDADGAAYVNVNGSSSGVSGSGFTQAYLGYYTTFIYPPYVYPEMQAPGLPVVVIITDLSGQLAPISGTYSVRSYSYDFMNNTYMQIESIALTYNPSLNAWIGFTGQQYPSGPVLLVSQGSYGMLPYMAGVDLQTMFILPQDVVEPGAAGPGQYIIVEGLPMPPATLAQYMSTSTGLPVYDNVLYGSNITAELISPTGRVVSTANVPLSDSGIYLGYLRVPENATPGLYDVVLSSFYNSNTLGENITGSYYGQVYVYPSSTPRITVTKEAFEGQRITVYANITYQNGTEVKYGFYVGALYSNDVKSGYGSYLFNSGNGGFILTYDPQINEWVGSIATPSPLRPFQYNATTGQAFVGPQGYSGPYDVFIAGISWNGAPTNASLDAEAGLSVMPYMYVSGSRMVNSPQLSYLALSDSNITASGPIGPDYFLGGDSIYPAGEISIEGSSFEGANYIYGGAATITGSTSSGTIYAYNTEITLNGFTGGSLVAVNSSVTLINSHLSSLVLDGSTVTMNYSSASSISPAPPSISISSPTPSVAYNSTVPVSINVAGQGISQVTISVDGSQVASFNHGGQLSLQLNASSYPDGTHSLAVIAKQSDGISSTAYTQFETEYQLSSASSELRSISTSFMYEDLAVGVIGILLAVIAIYLALRKRT